MNLPDLLQLAAAVAGIILVASSVVGGIIWIIARKLASATDERKDHAQAQLISTLEGQRDAYKLERDELAGKVPDIEGKLKALRDEVGATKAISELRQELAANFSHLSTMLANHEDRAQRADRQQAEWNRAATRALNDMAARLHISSIIEVEAPGKPTAQ